MFLGQIYINFASNFILPQRMCSNVRTHTHVLSMLTLLKYSYILVVIISMKMMIGSVLYTISHTHKKTFHKNFRITYLSHPSNETKKIFKIPNCVV